MLKKRAKWFVSFYIHVENFTSVGTTIRLNNNKLFRFEIDQENAYSSYVMKLGSFSGRFVFVNPSLSGSIMPPHN